jgi:hypothetical protein
MKYNLEINQDLKTVDALIIFHHEWRALENCARSYREFYPTGKLFIARDNLPMKNQERLTKFAPSYIKTYSTTQFFINLRFNDETLDDITDEEFIEKLYEDLSRMKDTLEQCSSKYLLYMEADSKITSQLNIKRDFDMDSLDANPYPNTVLEMILKLSGKELPISGWGFVTGLIKVQSALRMIEWAKANNEILLKIFQIDRRFIYLDYFAPILMHLSGGIVIKSGIVGECLRDKSWRRKNYSLLHQYRLDY